jgi:hypothetical protein
MRIYLAITFWGEEYRRYFLDYCLASLLAPGNIPAITDKAAARLLIATNERDWAALQAEPTFLAVKSWISIEHVPFDEAAYANSHGKMLVMSQAHKRLAERMFEDRANGTFIYPDMIAATGFIAKLQQLRERGYSVVMFMNVRFANEALLGELKERGLLSPGEPVALAGKELARLTIRHMHSEMKRSAFESDCDDFGCSSFFWVVAPDTDILFHCGSWIPSLIDYGSIKRPDYSTFEYCTLDGDYVARNLTDSNSVYFVRDTSELFMISFTPEVIVNYPLAPVLRYRIPRLRTSLKIVAAHRFLYQQSTMDWLIKQQFRLPIRFRGGDSTEREWLSAERRAAAIVARMERGGSSADRILYWSWLIIPTCRAIWRNRRAVARRIGQVMRGDRVAWKRAMWRMRQVAHQFLGRPFSDPEPRM